MVDEPLAPFATRYAPTGMVCSVDHLASGAGVAVLRAGGSAADAAVATSAVLAVTSQHLCGMGGDLFAVVHTGTGAPTVLNASGRAGSGADPGRARAEGLTALPLQGDIRSVPVPGCVDGWVALHDRFGRLPLAEVLDAAVGYAEYGFPASPTLAGLLPSVRQLPGAEDYRTAPPARPGDVFRRPGVARALRSIGTGGRAAWYEGEFGEDLLRLGAGEYVAADLARSQADWVEPLGVRAWGVDVWTVPPNSQGYLTLSSARLADGLPLPDHPADPHWAHLLVEASRQAGRDRLSVLHEGADGPSLIADGRLDPRRARIGARRGEIPGEPPPLDGDTIHLAVIDGDRMSVSLTQSNARAGAPTWSPPAPGSSCTTGASASRSRPATPAEYGPGRRPPSTLSPALFTTPDGRLGGVLGTMGGDSQPQILLQVLARLLHAGQAPGEAVASGRWVLDAGDSGFATWAPATGGAVLVEGHAPAGWDAGLADRGHAVRRTAPFGHQYGHAHVILAEGDRLAGASDPRPRSGSASGY